MLAAMGLQTVAKVAQSFDGTFECQHCGHEAGATVFAKSSGAARGVGADAERIAVENAENDANALASRTLQFVRCPKCGRTDPSGRSYRVQATVGSIVIGLVGAGLMYLYAKIRTDADDAETARWASIGFGVFLATLLYWKWGRPWRSPDKRTIFRP
jgi:transcription elongation factor Elf1